MLFAFHVGMEGVLLDPHLEVFSGDPAVFLVGRNAL